MPRARTDPAPQRKTVAVIGGGLAGLAAAKAAIQAGLLPTVFDRRASVGGMWGDSAASTYASLHTNVSRFSCSFSDFPWPHGSPDYPTAAQVGHYLSAYQAAFLPPTKCLLQLDSEVLRVLPHGRCPQAAAEAAQLQQQQQHTGDSPRPAQAPSWVVEWREVPQPGLDSGAASTSDGCRTACFDFVVVASGFCAAPRMPPVPGLASFPGLLLHSSAYRGPHLLAGRRRVAVVGAGHSAADIAADLAAAATSAAATTGAADPSPGQTPGGSGPAAPPMEVIHVTPRPFWVIPRYLPLNPESASTPFAPLDVMLYRWSTRPGGEAKGAEQLFPTREERPGLNAFFDSICGDQGALLSPVLAVPSGSSDPPVVAISDAYRPLVASGRLKLRSGRLCSVSGSTLELSPGAFSDIDGAVTAAASGTATDAAAADGPAPPSQSLYDVDAIVLCTGMHPSLPFLPSDVLETLSYTPHDSYVPLALHRQVLHPDVPGLAFVGVFRSPFFAVVELQARLAAAAFAGTLPAAEADPAAQRAGVELELRVRHHTPRPPYPHTDYVGHADGLAAALGVRPPPEWRAQHDVVIAAHYGVIRGPSEAPAAATPPVAQDGKAGPGRNAAAAAAGAREPDVEAAPAAVRQALDDMAAAMRRYRSGHRVASAVFQDLAGEWDLRRRIVSRLPSSPSGQVTGTARFTATAAVNDGGVYTPSAGGAGGLSYLYEEHGQFAVQGGAVMRVRREYVYMYDNTADRIEVYFADGGSKRGGFFHSLRFLPPPAEVGKKPGLEAATEGGVDAAPTPDFTAASDASASTLASPTVGWRAVGEHLCIRDMYNASYNFIFQGLQLRQFEIEFRVRGPNKDYTATATYTRRAPGRPAPSPAA